MKYINVSDKDLTIPGIGKVKSGEEIKTTVEIRNANFEKITPEIVKAKRTINKEIKKIINKN